MPQSVLGIDLGGFGARVAKVESGGVIVLANEMSVRETPSVVSFPSSQKGVRSAGASSQPHLITQAQSSIGQIRSLLGSRVVKKEALELQQDASDKITQDGGVNLVIGGQNQVLQPEQIGASFLTHLRKTVVEPAKDADIRGGDDYYVLSVPQYFTDGEKAAVLDAAEIAKFKVMAIVNDLTASALSYGYFQRDLPKPSPSGIPAPGPHDPVPKQQLLTERPRLVIFVDFGYGGLRAALAEFTSAGFKMLGKAGDRHVGGRKFDERLAKYFMEKFNGQYSKQIGKGNVTPLSIHGERKAYAKLLTAAEKTKRLLSANKESIPVHLECLHDDLDLSTKISRQEFEELCGDLFERVRGCLSELIMKVPDIDLADLHSVEVLGGSSRIPKFKNIIEEIFGKTPSTTLHATESSAKGCALMCAALTRIYSVKPFQVVDLATPHNINIRYTPVSPPLEANDTNNAALVSIPKVVTQTIFKDTDTKHNEVVMLHGRPQGDTIVMEYESATCKILKENLIAIYQLEFQGDNVIVGANDDLLLQICINNNGRPRLRKCKWIQRDINGGETEVDLRFSETRVGGLPEKDLVQYIHAEERMQKSDHEEEKRQEIKNSLEENVFQFKDELTCSEDGIKEQKAWKECMQFVSNVENQITNYEDYENQSTEVFMKQLEGVNEKFASYRKWKEDYNKYMQNKKVQQQINNTTHDNDRYTRKRESNIRSPRQAPKHSAYNVASDPFSPIFSRSFPAYNQYIFPQYTGGNRNSYYCTPRSSFLNLF